MIAVLLAFGAAVTFGLSDFIGGIAGRRTSAWTIALMAGLGGAVFAAAVALAQPASPGATDLWWGALAGIGSGFGGGFLYRGLSTGRMGVVAPVSGLTAAALPVAVGVLTGERPSALVWAGIVIALPAIWLVAREPVQHDVRTGIPTAGLLDGVLAGLGFGLQFAALAQAPDTAGFWPLAIAQLVGVGVIVLIATVLRAPWVPRDRSSTLGVVPGVLGGLAMLGFLLATHRGYLSVSAVLTSLYPVVTVVLAATMLREHVHRTQLVGMLMCGITVVCVALG